MSGPPRFGWSVSRKTRRPTFVVVIVVVFGGSLFQDTSEFHFQLSAAEHHARMCSGTPAHTSWALHSGLFKDVDGSG